MNYRPPRYSRETRRLHGEMIIAFFGSDESAQIKALKDLAKSVHCDLTGELREPHGLQSTHESMKETWHNSN